MLTISSFILYQQITMKDPNIKKIWWKTFHRCYGPNFYRFEQEDEDKGYFHIYINNEDVETCPLAATIEEVDMRFHDLLAEHGIEDDNMFVRKEII